MSEVKLLVLGRFEIADWNAFVETYAGSPFELLEIVAKDPESFADDINGAAVRSRNKKDDFLGNTNNKRFPSYPTMPPIDGQGFFAQMNHNYTA